MSVVAIRTHQEAAKPFTPQMLLEMAEAAEARYRSLLAAHPPGTIHDGRNAARREMEDALACAAWMEKHGLASLANVGPFMTQTFRRGLSVQIRKGARVFTTKPGSPKEGVEAKIAQWIVVRSFTHGFVREGAVYQAEITWAGAVGYWRWKDVNNIQFI